MKPSPLEDGQKNKFPAIFFLLVFILSALFWLLGGVVEQYLPEERSVNLPFSSLMVICPIIAASILVYKEAGADGVKALLRRCVDYQRIDRKIWFIPTLLLWPFVMLLMYAWLKLNRSALPGLQAPDWSIAVFFLIFFIAALGEEVGWQGYAIDRMQSRWNALTAGLMLGLIWAIWHILPNIQANNTPMWIAWQSFNLFTSRVLYTWLYNNTGKSVFATALFHAMHNVSTMLFPNYGLPYNPILSGIIVAAIVALVTYLWGAKTLDRFRYAGPRTEIRLGKAA